MKSIKYTERQYYLTDGHKEITFLYYCTESGGNFYLSFDTKNSSACSATTYFLRHWYTDYNKEVITVFRPGADFQNLQSEEVAFNFVGEPVDLCNFLAHSISSACLSDSFVMNPVDLDRIDLANSDVTFSGLASTDNFIRELINQAYAVE